MKMLMLSLSLFVPFFAQAQGSYSDEAVVICDVPSKDWKKVQETGYLEVSPDSKDPFIHCARPSQFFYVMNKYFKGGTWMVMVTHADRVKDILRYENDYPHLYGKLDLKDVVHTLEVSPDENGYYILPSIFAKDEIKMVCETVMVDSCVGDSRWSCWAAYVVECKTRSPMVFSKDEAQKVLKRLQGQMIRF